MQTLASKGLTGPRKAISYTFIWNGYQLPEKFNQPLGVQNHCSALLGNYPQIMIKSHHEFKLFFISYEALSPGKKLKLFNFQIVHLFLCQSTDDLFKVQPPR